MSFVYRAVDAFPPLAWTARRDAPDAPFVVTHGRYVETRPAFFIEGAWAGTFGEGRIDASDAVFGSGGCETPDATVFAGSTATTDFLYYALRGGAVHVANSLPLLLAAIDDALLPGCERYSAINLSIIDGIRRYQPSIPTRDGEVRRVVHANVVVRDNGVSLVDKPMPPSFRTFAEYRALLADRVGALLSNGRDPARRQRLHVYSTQSKGYDTTAVNAIAAPFGIERVFTSPDSKEKTSFYLGAAKGGWPSDDGAPICAALGLPCTPIDRTHFERGLTHEHYQWAGLDNNQDLNLVEIQSHLIGPTLLLTGNLGEIWYTKQAIGEARMPTFNDELIRWDHAGHGMGEIRLVAGFVQVAVPFILARHRQAILAITESEEMAPWRLNRKYDRPIPRRIGEEAGVPREAFGQVKLASVVQLPMPNVPLTPSLRREFLRHLRREGLLGRARASLLRGVQRFNSVVHWRDINWYFKAGREHPVLYYTAKVWERVSGRPFEIPMLMTRVDSWLYAFCVNKVRDEYRAHLDSTRP